MAKDKPKSVRYTEVERKFDVDDTAVAPSFDGLTVIAHVELSPTQELDATYFDTAEHDLARNRITLRRRRGGPDDGWHLKLPAGPDSRTEVHVPVDSEDVPEELRDVVLAVVRDRPLVPVARIQTTRQVQSLRSAEGPPLAEFCDDQVTASAGENEQQWREWELELAPGVDDFDLLDRLSNRLIDAGARPAGHGSKLARILPAKPEGVQAPKKSVQRAIAEHVDELIIWDRAVRADAWDSVHQMRVTIRKLRSLLKEVGFDKAEDAWVLDELRQLAAILGTARDAEVLGEKYQQALDALPEALIRGPVHERLVGGARRRYDTGLRRSLMAMRTPRYFRLLDALEHVSALPSDSDDTPVSLDAAYRRVRKAAKHADAADAVHHDEALHRIRKSAKRLRYTAAATGKAKVSEAAKTIQTLLGDHQDAVVSRTHLAKQAQAAHEAGEDTFTYGVLYQREDQLARDARDQLGEALKKLKKAM